MPTLNVAVVDKLRDAFVNSGTIENLGERKMFGGVCFTMSGNMVGGVLGDDLMMKCDKETSLEDVEKILKGIKVYEMDFTGRVMRGFYKVDGTKLTDAEIERCAKFSASQVAKLPMKEPRAKKKASKSSTKKSAKKKPAKKKPTKKKTTKRATPVKKSSSTSTSTSKPTYKVKNEILEL